MKRLNNQKDLKDTGSFNKNDIGQNDMSENEKALSKEVANGFEKANAENRASILKDEDIKNEDEFNDEGSITELEGIKKDNRKDLSVPKVTPSTIICTAIFCILFLLAYNFYPYIEMLLPFGGTTVRGNITFKELTSEELIQKAEYIVTGKVKNFGEVIRDEDIRTSDAVGCIVYTEVYIEINEILLGEGKINKNEDLKTYQLGGSFLSQDMRPEKINVEYEYSADLAKGDAVLLFLDNEFNIINEKYGVYKQSKEEYYCDHKGNFYSIQSIKEKVEQIKSPAA